MTAHVRACVGVDVGFDAKQPKDTRTTSPSSVQDTPSDDEALPLPPDYVRWLEHGGRLEYTDPVLNTAPPDSQMVRQFGAENVWQCTQRPGPHDTIPPHPDEWQLPDDWDRRRHQHNPQGSELRMIPEFDYVSGIVARRLWQGQVWPLLTWDMALPAGDVGDTRGARDARTSRRARAARSL